MKFNFVQWATIMLVCALAVIVPINFVQLNHTVRAESKAARQSTQALCLLRKNYLDQYKSTIDYLKKHPKGAPALGVTAKALRQAAGKELAAANSLRDVNCAG